MRTTRSILLGLGAAALLAGCGSAASSSSGSAAGAASTSASAVASASQAASQAAGAGANTALSCSLAPPTLVGSDLGVTGLGTPKETSNSAGAACVYSAANGIVSLEMFNGATAAKMDTEKQTLAKSEPTKDLPGLGDQAYTASLPAGGALASPNTLVARKGSVEIMIVSTASVSAEQSLAQHLFAKIG